MSESGKKHQQAKDLISQQEFESWRDVLEVTIKSAHAKFDESVDVDIVLGIDPTKGEQGVRGAALLPHGTGKQVRVVVFAKGKYEEEAKSAGADFVGAEDLIEKIQGGWMEFDASVATPDMMVLVGKVARVLGPRGLLPNKKVGTVTFDIAAIVSDLKKGRVSYKNDKGGVIHASFGRISFGVDKLLENLSALVRAIRSSRPPTAKGKFIKKITVSSTMGVGVMFDSEEIV